MTTPRFITVSAPGKIHLLGEHSVVYGKPALLAAIDLRVSVTISSPVITRRESSTGATRFAELSSARNDLEKLRKVIEPIVKQYLNIKTIPPYQVTISSQIPIGVGLGSSAAISAAYIAALLTFLKVKWDLNSINNLTFEAEKIFHGNPSGGDNSAVVYGGFIWFRKETADLKLIHPLNIIFPRSRNFVLIHTGIPKESTKEMVEMVSAKSAPSSKLWSIGDKKRSVVKAMEHRRQSAKFKKIFDNQEQLVKQLLSVLRDGDEDQLIQIIKAGEKNLESMGVVSPFVKSIIRKIEKTKGCAKICGGGGKTKATGMLLCYHPSSHIIKKIAKFYKLDYIKTELGVEGLKLDPT